MVPVPAAALERANSKQCHSVRLQLQGGGRGVSEGPCMMNEQYGLISWKSLA